jgi:hypothetical protein
MRGIEKRREAELLDVVYFPADPGVGKESNVGKVCDWVVGGGAGVSCAFDFGRSMRECTRLVNAVEGRSASGIFGFPDDLKFHSSMTLYAKAGEGEQVFREALEKYFGGKMDGGTMGRI